MAKVTVQDVTDAGFRPEQFGTPSDFADATTGYVARIIVDAAIWVQAQVGASVYTAAAGGSIDELRLKRAELCYVKAELWRRRAAFLDSNAQSSLEGGSGVYLERREFLQHAKDADNCAQFNVDVINNGGDVSASEGGISLGHAETGPFSTEEVTA